MFPGYQLRLGVACGACGHAMFNALQGSSAFLALACENPNCEMHSARMVVERATMIVLWTNFKMIDGKPTWPSHWKDASGIQVEPRVRDILREG